jgi:hypothetical protein
MEISDKLRDYLLTLSEMRYTGPESLDKIRSLAEASISAFSMRIIGNKYLDQYVPCFVQFIEMALQMIANVVDYPDEEKEDGFFNAAAFLENNLKDAVAFLNYIGM